MLSWMWRYQQEIGTQECHHRTILQMMPRGSNSKPTLMPFSRNRATRWPLKHLKAFRSLLSVLKWGDWVSTESTVHSCLKSQANKNPLVEGPEAEWIQQTVFVQRNRKCECTLGSAPFSTANGEEKSLRWVAFKMSVVVFCTFSRESF